MAVERDCNAERLARIEMLMADARNILARQADASERRQMCARLDRTLKELGARVPLMQSLPNFSPEN
jgi:hypothetical protein